MKILFDNNVPVYLIKVFQGHTVSTAYREGWADLVNGKLLTETERAGFDMLVTLDKNFQHQQNMNSRNISVVILDPQGQQEENMVLAALSLLERLDSILPGQIIIARGNNK